MIDRIKALMKNHDWFFDYSDDQKNWRNGMAEKERILTLMRQIPMCEVPALLELVPEKLRDQWFIELQRVAKPTLNSHPPQEDEAW